MTYLRKSENKPEYNILRMDFGILYFFYGDSNAKPNSQVLDICLLFRDNMGVWLINNMLVC